MAEALALLSAKKTISVLNTAEQLATTSQVITGLSVKAPSTNSGDVQIGSSSVGANSYPLSAGESIEFDIIDPTKVYVRGAAGDVVFYFGLIP